MPVGGPTRKILVSENNIDLHEFINEDKLSKVEFEAFLDQQ